MVLELSPEELKTRLDAGERPRVIDVREAWELDISKVDFAEHIPMGQIPDRLGELDPQVELVIMCRSGGRSLQVARFLEGHGFRSVSNLTGGILAWGERIDPSLRPY
jgi:adenylyltransferase/sulfurtransferase